MIVMSKNGFYPNCFLYLAHESSPSHQCKPLALLPHPHPTKYKMQVSATPVADSK